MTLYGEQTAEYEYHILSHWNENKTMFWQINKYLALQTDFKEAAPVRQTAFCSFRLGKQTECN